MTGLKDRPLTLFFGFAFLISWGLWFVSMPLYKFSFDVAAMVGILGTCGPLLSALVVTAVTQHDDAEAPWPEIWKTLGPVFLVLSIAAALGYTHTGLFKADLFVGVMIVSAAAYLLYRMSARPDDFNFNAVDILSPDHPWLWPGAALILPFLMVALGGVCYLIEGDMVSVFSYVGDVVEEEGVWKLTLVFSAVLLILGPMGEEPGWRGFALPLLLRRHSPLVASLVIGAVWGVWHLPIDLAGGEWNLWGQALLRRAGITLPSSIIFTWLYVRSGGSMVSSLLLHTSMNFTWVYVYPWHFTAVMMTPFALLFIFTSKMWRKRTPG